MQSFDSQEYNETFLQNNESMEVDDNSFSTFFAETGTGVHTPRAVFVDLEPTVKKNQHSAYLLKLVMSNPIL